MVTGFPSGSVMLGNWYVLSDSPSSKCNIYGIKGDLKKGGKLAT
jgi:hypothetical protein